MGDLRTHFIDLGIGGQSGDALHAIAEIEFEIGDVGKAGHAGKPAVFDEALSVFGLEAELMHMRLDLDEHLVGGLLGGEPTAEGDRVLDVAEIPFDDGLAVFDEDLEDAFVLVEGAPGREGFSLEAAF